MRFQWTVLAPIAAATVAFAAQAPISLQRALVENSVDTYKSTSKVSQTLQSPLGDFPFTITSATTYTLKTNKIDTTKGVADVELTSSIDSVDGGDSPITAGLSKAKPAPMVQQGTMDKFGHLDLKAPEKADRTMAVFAGISGGLQSSLFVELPRDPVKVGDSWDIVIPKGDYTGDTDQKIKAKLTGDKKVDGKDLWTVDISGTVNMKFDSLKLGPPQPQASNALDKYHVVADGVTTLKATALIDKGTGKTFSLDSESDIKMTIHLPDEGDTTGQSSGTLTTSLKLQS